MASDSSQQCHLCISSFPFLLSWSLLLDSLAPVPQCCRPARRYSPWLPSCRVLNSRTGNAEDGPGRWPPNGVEQTGRTGGSAGPNVTVCLPESLACSTGWRLFQGQPNTESSAAVIFFTLPEGDLHFFGCPWLAEHHRGLGGMG